MDFFNLKEYTMEDIQYLIDFGIEESIHLDYKTSGALDKSETKKKEISKDVSAFANSDGGIIIYGVEEQNHKAAGFSYIDGNNITKEWLEQVINSTINQKIKGIEIFPIRNNGNIAESIYLVKIPRSYDAPHMCRDKCYYKRYNFESVKMEEYEVRDLFNRHNLSKLLIDECTLNIISSNAKSTIYQFCAKICNESNTAETLYKLNCYVIGDVACYNFKVIDKGNYTELDKHRLKISFVGKEPIFAYECLDMARFRIEVPVDFVVDFERNASIELKLFYENNISECKIYVYELLS